MTGVKLGACGSHRLIAAKNTEHSEARTYGIFAYSHLLHLKLCLKNKGGPQPSQREALKLRSIVVRHYPERTKYGGV